MERMGSLFWMTSLFAFVSVTSSTSSSSSSYPSSSSSLTSSPFSSLSGRNYYHDFGSKRYKSPFLDSVRGNPSSGSVLYVYPKTYSSSSSGTKPQSSSSSFRSIPSSVTSNTQLMSSPSIVSSAQIPFIFGRKKKGQSIVRSKPYYAASASSSSTSPSSTSSDGIDWSSDEMMQHPIDELPRKSNRDLGQPCSYSSDCGSGCCLLDRSTKIRSCQPLARLQERCTNSQVKGDLYVDACPCESGSEYCSVNQKCSW